MASAAAAKGLSGHSIAYLGPNGSYCELALKEHLAPQKTVSCVTIAEVFAALIRGEAAYGFVPIENVLQGPVSETLDSLLRHKGEVAIVATFLTKISHALGIRPEAELSEIKAIRSHEQALRQCAAFLRSTLPNAELQPAASTGNAAEAVAAQKLKDTAVIANKETLLQLGYTIVSEDIADSRDNKTRFALVAKGDAKSIALAPQTEVLLEQLGFSNTTGVTSIALRPGRDRQGILFEVLQIISQQQHINLVSIHSRPDERGVFAFHFDLEGHLREERIERCLEALEQYCRQSTKSVADVVLFGSFPQRRFYELPFRSIGIVGGAGVMGQWFSNFFAEIGLEVLIADTGTGVSLKELIERCEVILLSVPMSAFGNVISEAASLLRPGQLVVENSSIKSAALPALEKLAPAGVEILGIHTMFGAAVESLRGENVIITRTERSGAKAQALEDLLYKFGAKITRADIQTHDQKSAFLQSLFQATLVALAETMGQTFASAEELEPFSTPNSRNVLESMRRVLNQTDNLLEDLQRLNSEYPEVRRQFLQTMFNLLAELEHGTDDFLARANKGRAFLKAP